LLAEIKSASGFFALLDLLQYVTIVMCSKKLSICLTSSSETLQNLQNEYNLNILLYPQARHHGKGYHIAAWDCFSHLFDCFEFI
jgi:hypothetical protein